ncbi:MAG: metallophosphoesterase [Rhodoferax sp.]|nr:metallophosphoesterase [Rhodoferax sp.]
MVKLSKKINDALLAMIDRTEIEAARNLVSAAMHGNKRVWMTSDLHFRHTNIIGYCGRPFRSVKHQDETLLRLLNKVGPQDIIVFVGDMAMGTHEDAVPVLESLPGRKILVAGKHDLKNGVCRLADEAIFEHIVPVLFWQGQHEDQVLVSHYPVVEFFPLGVKRLVNYHGHLHQHRKEDTDQIKYINVGWDQTYGLLAL